MLVHREEIPVKLTTWLLVLFGLLACRFAYVLLYQLFIVPIGDRLAPDWFWGLMTAIYVAMFFVLRSFRRLTLEITETYISVGFGPFRRTISWERIAGVRRDGRSPLAYGGIGLRVARRRGGRIMAFVDFRNPRIVLELRGGKLQELVFSTRNPERVQRIIEERLGKFSSR